ncbi:hypothetical protein EFP18_08050 [Burkholderia glumae]|uniref:hypothetical protein n=1 Tax=Burkholderia glumae TaxID=337 RepID=UPI0005C29E9F|nr:hypothetical protein [Burkholderia glumae]MCM2495327.1 hypothetical protein [Burkholderia glumae]MCM2546329.1 hypothetical protein [Burkholderia glumae]MCM2552020.1 hypothetical protein [Burkholderia glumae]MCQ0032907.1 hypothetical protein [Burkholderia glumae]MCQ0037535.1 hypothetical protein [Burkholderia glumae]
MLSPHELATLMLIDGAPEAIDPDRAELGTLLQYRLVRVEADDDGIARPELTESGRSLLAAAGRIAPQSPRPAIRDLGAGA